MGRSWFCGTPVVCDVPNLFSWSGTHSSFLWAGPPGLAGCSAHNLFSEAGTYVSSPVLVHTLGPVFCSLVYTLVLFFLNLVHVLVLFFLNPVHVCIRVYAGPVFCSQAGLVDGGGWP